jgi:hypothetical protein
MKPVLVLLFSILSVPAFAASSVFNCGAIPSNLHSLPESVKHYIVTFTDGNAYLSYSTTLTMATPGRKMKLINKGITGSGAAYLLKGISVSVIGDNVTIGNANDPESIKACQRTR